MFKNADKIFHVAVLLIFGLGISYLVYDTKYGDKFYPGIYIGGESVGGRTEEEVLSYFGDKSAVLQEEGITLKFEGANGVREVQVPMFADGLTPDVSVEYFSFARFRDIISEAYSIGHTGSTLSRLKEQLSTIFWKKEFDSLALVRSEAIQSLLERELDDFFVPPKPAEFFIDGSEILISTEKDGEFIDSERVLETIQGRLASLDPEPIDFKVQTTSPLQTAEKLEPYLSLANEFANKTTLAFNYKGRKWKVSGQKFATWLTIKDGDRLGVDSKKLDAFLTRTVAPLINDPAQNSRFEVRGGQFVEILKGKPGNVVDVKKTAEKVERIIPSVDESFKATGNLFMALSEAGEAQGLKVQAGTVDIPVEITRSDPRVTAETIEQYNIKDLVGYAKTSFKGSGPDRIHNIKKGVEKLTGILLAPGETFSAVKGLGFVTEEEGFRKEYVIKDNKSIKELGGGLCQIATTLFRLALDTGLPITARTPHRYVVKYYGPGLDATVYRPDPDLRFVNDTPNYILLQGEVRGTDLIFEFYGQKDGRSVHISEPIISDEKEPPPVKYIDAPEIPKGITECSETPRKGMTAEVTYTVTHADGSVHKQDFKSVYQPWNKICLVGTGDPNMPYTSASDTH